MSKNNKIQVQQNDLLSDDDWNKIKSSVLKQYIESERQNTVIDQLLIQEQSQLMEQIKQKIKRTKHKEALSSMEVLPLDYSISNISSQYNFADDQSLIKNKFAEQFQSSLVNSALKQVKSTCSEQTYDTFRKYVIDNKVKQCQQLSKTLEKTNKQNEELSLAIIMKQNELLKLKEQVAPYFAKAEFFQEEKKKWKKKNDQVTEKQILLHKMERALIFKQKMHQQAKRRGEKLKQFTDGIYCKMKSIETDLNNLRIQIQTQMKAAENMDCCQEKDKQVCWKKQIMKKFRQKLLEQRSIIKQEQKHLQKRYQILQNVSEQCKKLVSQSYQGLLSTIGSGGSAIQINNKEQRPQKLTSLSLIDKR